MTINEKVSYLKGLAEGLEIKDTTKEGKLLIAIVDILEDMALTVTDLEDSHAELSEYVELIDEGLEEVESEIFDEDFEDEDEDDACGFVCPACGEEIELEDEDFTKEEIACPVCGQLVELDFEDCCCGDDECECGCDCDEDK